MKKIPWELTNEALKFSILVHTQGIEAAKSYLGRRMPYYKNVTTRDYYESRWRTDYRLG
mgnify:CR=1 FL=1